jgi:hypothetical protein
MALEMEGAMIFVTSIHQQPGVLASSAVQLPSNLRAYKNGSDPLSPTLV